MAKIEETDKNLKVISEIDKPDIKWYSANSEPFQIWGVYYENGEYKRMDSAVAKSVSNGVNTLHKNTSGGRITFETKSKYVALWVTGNFTVFSHMPVTGTAGFDLYIFDETMKYYKTFVPPVNVRDKYESIIEFDSEKNRKIMIHFPLYSDVKDVYIGLSENCEPQKFSPYKKCPPVVYYGSSITQGGCASRPGNNYPAIVSQKNLTDFICLGFSGNAHGEKEMADYIAGLNMSAFVLDYDHNDIRNPENLEKRHYAFYKTVREKNPDIPIIFMTAPYSPEYEKILSVSGKIVEESFKKAAKTDKNVGFIDCKKIFEDGYEICVTVDSCHPNDYGFVKMAQAVLKALT